MERRTAGAIESGSSATEDEYKRQNVFIVLRATHKKVRRMFLNVLEIHRNLYYYKRRAPKSPKSKNTTVLVLRCLVVLCVCERELSNEKGKGGSIFYIYIS